MRKLAKLFPNDIEFVTFFKKGFLAAIGYAVCATFTMQRLNYKLHLYLLSCNGQKATKGSVSLQVRRSPVRLSTTQYSNTVRAFTLTLFIAKRQSRKLCFRNYIAFGLNRLGIKPKSTVLEADSLSTRTLMIGKFTSNC